MAFTLLPADPEQGLPGQAIRYAPSHGSAATSVVARIVILAVCVVYATQVLSPLRLNSDAIRLLEIAASVLRGEGFTYRGAPTHFPPGYPALLAGIELLGARRAAMLVMVNLSFLIAGLWGARRIAIRALGLGASAATWVTAIALLSFVIIKHTTLPLTDIPYLGVAMLALVALDRYEESHRLQWLLAGLLAALLATLIRTVGVALLPAILWTILGSRLRRHWQHNRRFLYVIAASLAVIGVVGMLVITRSQYGREALAVYRGIHPVAGLGHNVIVRLSEAGELALNAPASKMPHSIAPATVVLGVPLCALLLLAIWRRHTAWGAVDVYVLAYLGVLLLWPYADTRFWIPLVPLIAAYGATLIKRLPARLITGWMMATGTIALAYSTWLSFMPLREFAQHYGTDELRPAYVAAARGAPATEFPAPPLSDAYELLSTWK
jgi:hypothetical protein